MFDLVQLVFLHSHMLPPAGTTAAAQLNVGCSYDAEGSNLLKQQRHTQPKGQPLALRTRRFPIRRKWNLKVDFFFLVAAGLSVRVHLYCIPNHPVGEEEPSPGI